MICQSSNDKSVFSNPLKAPRSRACRRAAGNKGIGVGLQAVPKMLPKRSVDSPQFVAKIARQSECGPPPPPPPDRKERLRRVHEHRLHGATATS